MTRRQSECFRNLDDPLKVFSLLTVKSCGLVLLFYAAMLLLELLFGVFSLLFDDLSFVAQLGAALMLGAVLVHAERQDDEHLVPAAIRYYASRRWRVLYSGAVGDRYTGNPLEPLVAGGPWRR